MRRLPVERSVRVEGGFRVTTKEKLLTLLASRQGTFVSGEEIAGDLCVSRAAVWKAVKSLQQAGYHIDATTNRGYRLCPQGDILSVPGVKKYLQRDLPLTVVSSVESTNTALRSLAEQGAPEGTVLLANSQGRGRGRLGRAFFSPGDTGLYLSLLLRPNHLPPQKSLLLTAAAASAMCQAMESLGISGPRIKWVNDIFVEGKKVCGILSEAAFSLETGTPEYIVIGAGVNLYPPQGGFPTELEGIAGALWQDVVSDGRNRLAAAFLDRFFALYRSGTSGEFLEDYRRRSLVIGKDVQVLMGNQEETVHALGIDDQCRLMVRYSSGETAALSYGEVKLLL